MYPRASGTSIDKGEECNPARQWLVKFSMHIWPPPRPVTSAAWPATVIVLGRSADHFRSPDRRASCPPSLTCCVYALRHREINHAARLHQTQSAATWWAPASRPPFAVIVACKDPHYKPCISLNGSASHQSCHCVDNGTDAVSYTYK